MAGVGGLNIPVGLNCAGLFSDGDKAKAYIRAFSAYATNTLGQSSYYTPYSPPSPTPASRGRSPFAPAGRGGGGVSAMSGPLASLFGFAGGAASDLGGMAMTAAGAIGSGPVGAAAAVVGVAVGGFMALQKMAVAARDLRIEARRAGTSVEFFQEIGHAAHVTGGDVEAFSATINRFKIARENALLSPSSASSQRLMGMLGVTRGELEGMSTEDLIQKIAGSHLSPSAMREIGGRGAYMSQPILAELAKGHRPGYAMNESEAAAMAGTWANAGSIGKYIQKGVAHVVNDANILGTFAGGTYGTLWGNGLNSLMPSGLAKGILGGVGAVSDRQWSIQEAARRQKEEANRPNYENMATDLRAAVKTPGQIFRETIDQIKNAVEKGKLEKPLAARAISDARQQFADSLMTGATASGADIFSEGGYATIVGAQMRMLQIRAIKNETDKALGGNFGGDVMDLLPKEAGFRNSSAIPAAKSEEEKKQIAAEATVNDNWGSHSDTTGDIVRSVIGDTMRRGARFLTTPISTIWDGRSNY